MKNIIKMSLVTLSVIASNCSIANEITGDFIKSEIEIAHKQYFTGTPESSLYALEALSRLLESDQSEILKSEIGPNNLSFTYIRIGLLHEKLGSKSKANLYFTKAVNSYKGDNVQILQLKETVAHLDGKHSIKIG
jgi:hypothetical protein